ncbi:MAG: hypothetical protein ACI4V1_01000 [Eubacteriales bacterium]
MPKLSFASKTIEYEGPYGTGTRKYEIRLSEIDGIFLGTRERKVLFGLIKKQERYLELRTHGIAGIDAPIIYAESEEGRDEFNMFLEKAKQFAGDNDLKIERI